MIVIISGPINAGKSAVARRLSQLVAGSLYVDGDDLAPSDLPPAERWSAAIDLISLATLSIAPANLHLLVAFPVDDAGWQRIEQPLLAAGYAVTCVALAPALDAALSERDGRALSDRERARIQSMYDQGFHKPSFASLTIDNSGESVEETAQRIHDFLGLD